MSTPPSESIFQFVDIPLTLPEAHDALREMLVRAPHGDAPLIRLRVPVRAKVPLEWLQAQTTPEQIYWHPRNASTALAGVGVAKKYTGASALSEALDFLVRLPEEDDPPRFFGGFPFSDLSKSEEWESFGSGWFVLPRIEFHIGDEGGFLVLNILAEDDTETVLKEINVLKLPPKGSLWGVPPLSGHSFAPDYPQWETEVVNALETFRSGDLEKVVLARKTTFRFEDDLQAAPILTELQQRTPSCTHFLFQAETGTTFIGATPERLFRQDKNWLYTEAIAGTRRRGDTESEDTLLADELLTDPKEQFEHRLVRDYIVQMLGPLSSAIEAGKTDILRLATKRHLYTPIAAALRPEIQADDVLAALHPTPAVGGYETAGAIRHIAKTEPFDRGWYAGPIGWISADAAEFFVAIRSGLIRNDATGSRIELYSGAGIVPGSDPQAEWEEVETKLSDFLRVILPVS